MATTTTTKTNRYPGTCTRCGGDVRPGEGTISKPRGARRYNVKHVDCDGDGGLILQGGRYKRFRNGPCEDAPCCGCCGPHSGGYGDPYINYDRDPYHD